MGRKRSIPESAFGLVFKLYSEGYGYRRISSLLAQQGINTTRSSVERLVKGRGCYTVHREKQRVSVTEGTAPYDKGESLT